MMTQTYEVPVKNLNMAIQFMLEQNLYVRTCVSTLRLIIHRFPSYSVPRAAFAVLPASNEVPAASISKSRTSLELSCILEIRIRKLTVCLQDVPVVTIIEYPEVLTEGAIRLDLSKCSETEPTETQSPYPVSFYTDILLNYKGVMDSPVRI